MEEFVIRPGRAMVLWTDKAQRVTCKVASEVAISLTCWSGENQVATSGAKLEHEMSVSVKKPGRLKLVAQNASGTRKARGTIEVKVG